MFVPALRCFPWTHDRAKEGATGVAECSFENGEPPVQVSPGSVESGVGVRVPETIFWRLRS